jgi:putative effector of murein hydrolase LrgA (UPF0299 family)
MPALWARSDSESLAVGGVAEWLAQSAAAARSGLALLLLPTLVAVVQSLVVVSHVAFSDPFTSSR